jgi:hypothetical protein
LPIISIPSAMLLQARYWRQALVIPGVGRLYFTSTNLQVENDIPADTAWVGLAIVSGQVKVLAGVRLEIKPGTLVLFEGDASLTVNGQIVAKGKADSLITFTKLNSESSGIVTLKGYSSDSLSFCKFSHLDKGLKISKYSSSYNNIIEHCEFSYNTDEGLYDSGGKVKVNNSEFHDNGGDGLYLYNCNVALDSLTVTRNQKNGIYCYSVNSSSTISHSVFQINGKGNDSAPDGNMRIYNCSPKLHHNVVTSSAEYGIYGVNGAYPVMYQGTTNAANTITDNASHETYWDHSWPLLDEGHNNFSTEDDTVIYITASTSLKYLYAEHNYWGGGNPHTGTGQKTYYGPGTFDWDPCVYVEQFSVPGGEGIEGNMKGGGAGGFGTIADAEEDARDLLKDAIDDEEENPARAMEAYRRVITRFGNSSAAPIAVERLLWMVRDHFADNRRLDELNGLNILYRSLADTSHSRALAWKARRAALWTLAAMHDYDAAIAGFENIVENHNCLADSIFAVIDVGTLHLEAEAWAEHDTVDRVQSVPGRLHELCPADWPSHRRKTDELLALLNGGAYNAEPLIPDDYFLAQNYPNPFNSTTCIRYGLPDESQVKITIFDLTGRRVKTLVNEAMKAGYYTMVWDGRNETGIPVASGLYFYRINADNFTKVRKMTLVK